MTTMKSQQSQELREAICDGVDVRLNRDENDLGLRRRGSIVKTMGKMLKAYDGVQK